MVNIVHNGRRSIAHHKLEALYGKFAKAGAACAVTLENALALSVPIPKGRHEREAPN